MKMRKGQNLIEISVVGSIMLAVTLAGVFFFGDNLAEFFNSNNPSKFFTSKRFNVENKDIAQNYLSKIKILFNLNGKDIDINSPVEEILAQKMQDGTYVHTSGSSGNVKETVAVIKKYLEELSKLLDNAPPGTNIAALKNAITGYLAKINQYESMNGNTVNGADDPLKKLVNDLDITVDFSANGKEATNLSKALNDTLAGMPDGNYKKMVELFANSALTLGKSMDYSISSRIGSELQGDLANYVDLKYFDREFENKLSELQSYQSTLNTKNNNLTNKTNLFYSQKNNLNNQIEYSRNLVALAKSVSNEMYHNTELNNILYYLNIAKSENSYSNVGTYIPSSLAIDLAINNINNLIVNTPQFITTTYYETEKYCSIRVFGCCLNWDTKTVTKTGVLENPVYDKVLALRDVLGATKQEKNNMNNTMGTINTLKTQVSSLNNTVKVLSDYVNENSDSEKRKEKSIILAMQNLDTNIIDQAEREKIAQYISVYRTGTYAELLPDSFNNKKICESLNSSISDNQCILSD